MISLIVTTRNRVTELEHLLASLEEQSHASFETIVVDQNEDDRLLEVLAKHPALTIRHLRSGPGVSRGRNVGLGAAQGEVIAFPDDDCWYSIGLLDEVNSWFTKNSSCDGLLVGVRTAEGKLMAPKFPPPPGLCDRKSILRCSASVNIFVRSRAAKAVGPFREDIGVGSFSPYQSGEDLDYVIRCADLGQRLYYQPAFTVYHPDIGFSARSARTTYSYALGVGFVWRAHGYGLRWFLREMVGRSLGGAALRLCKGDASGAYRYAVRAAGQFRGYVFSSSNGMPSALSIR